MATTKFGLNQLKFNKGSKIYAKGDKADFAYYVHVGKVNRSNRIRNSFPVHVCKHCFKPAKRS